MVFFLKFLFNHRKPPLQLLCVPLPQPHVSCFYSSLRKFFNKKRSHHINHALSPEMLACSRAKKDEKRFLPSFVCFVFGCAWLLFFFRPAEAHFPRLRSVNIFLWGGEDLMSARSITAWSLDVCRWEVEKFVRVLFWNACLIPRSSECRLARLIIHLLIQL